MNVRASSRFASVLLAIGLAPAAGAMELGQSSAPPPTTSTITLPAFLDVAQLAVLQDAWRAHSNRAVTAATPVSLTTGDAEAVAIDQARQTLTHGEQVSRQAAAVRDRAEELSRRFAADADWTGTPTPDPSPAPVSPEDPAVTETASIAPASAEAAPVEAVPEEPARIEKATVVTISAAGEAAPASMLGGPPVEEAAASDPAPVIEDMAAKPAPQPKRAPAPPPARRVAETAPETPGFFSIFSSWGSSEEPAPAKKASGADNDEIMPREIRSFGWNAQP